MYTCTENSSQAVPTLAEQCRIDAENGYRSGRYNCAEAVLAAVRNHLKPELPEELLQAASGFGGGSGSGCICGAVSGATMGLGVLLGNDRKRISRLTRELHAWFRETYGATCCKNIRESFASGICPTLTGEVAARLVTLVRPA